MFPVKPPKKAKPTRRGIAFVVTDADGRAFLQTRPERGMLGGMAAFPSAGWTDADPSVTLTCRLQVHRSTLTGLWQRISQPVFTHFALTMDVAVARVDNIMDGAEWQKVRVSSLPTLMRKVWEAAESPRLPPSGSQSASYKSVVEMAHAGHRHYNAGGIGGGDYLIVSLRAARLDHRCGAGLNQRASPSAREKRVEAATDPMVRGASHP